MINLPRPTREVVHQPTREVVPRHLVIAGALAATQPEAAAMIQGAAEAYVVVPPNFARLISLIVTEALGEDRGRELRARGAEMHWDEAVAYTLTQTTQALNELQSETQP
jgi:hypothetical protein